MCGIAGYVCHDEYDPRLHLVMTNLGIRMQERGRKSWGWSNGNEIIKSLGEFVDGWNYSFYGSKQAALHTRQPTTGSLIKENSHPFAIGNIIGMHNGMVANHDKLQTQYNRKCQVDSEHIFHHINDELPLNEIVAYGAIVYWKDGHLFFGRFNNGQLTLARTESAWIFASTELSIRESLRFTGYKNYTIIKLRENALYSIKDDVLSEESALTFAQYDRSTYGTWDKPSTSYNYGNYQWRGHEPEKKTNPPVQTALPATTSPSTINVPKQEEFKLESELKKMVLATVSKKKHNLTISTSNGAVSSQKDDAILINDEPTIRCNITQNDIEHGEPFYITHDYNFVSEVAAKQMDSHSFLNSRPLTTQPEDLFKVSALIGINNMTERDVMGIECDECSQSFSLEDTIASMHDGTYMCMDCFAEGTAEPSEDDDEDDIADRLATNGDDDLADLLSSNDDDDDAGTIKYSANEAIMEPFDLEDQEHKISTMRDGSIIVFDKKTCVNKVYSIDDYIPSPLVAKLAHAMDAFNNVEYDYASL